LDREEGKIEYFILTDGGKRMPSVGPGTLRKSDVKIRVRGGGKEGKIVN